MRGNGTGSQSESHERKTDRNHDPRGGRITSDSGVLLLREIGRRTGVNDAFDKALRDPARFEHDRKAKLLRLENRADRKSLVPMAEASIDDFIATYDEPPESLIHEFDATDSEIHSHQESRFFHGDSGCFRYLPLCVICGDSLLTLSLRPSRIDAARHSQALVELLVRKLRAAWPKVHVTIRADSGLCRWRLVRRTLMRVVSSLGELIHGPIPHTDT